MSEENYIAVGHNTANTLNPYATKKGEKEICRHPDMLKIRIKEDARGILERFLYWTVVEGSNEFSKFSDIELDSMGWLVENRGKEFELSNDRTSDWHVDKYYNTMPVKGATGGLLLPKGLCELVQ